jgi:hypothetical protein
MKKIVILVLLIALFSGQLWAQEDDASLPFLTLNLILKDSIAFTGFGLEALLGNLGIAATFTTFFFGNDPMIFFYEPGVYVHFYFADPSAALYALVDVSFFSAGAMSGGETETAGDNGILNLNAGVGFNAYFGAKKNIHFSIELGARYPYIVYEGDAIDELNLPIFPHFQLQFGMGL